MVMVKTPKNKSPENTSYEKYSLKLFPHFDQIKAYHLEKLVFVIEFQ